MGSRRKVILYELNEVPWEVVDAYLNASPHSHLAQILARGQSLTTFIDDPVRLEPWRTWPSFHTSQHVADHNSFDLGQDPSTFRGETIWDTAESAGLSFGLFGPLQSWPARQPVHGGFWVPDTFARDEVCVPSSINRFQSYNLTATKRNSFSPVANLRTRELARIGFDVLGRGLTLRSASTLTRDVMKEQLDRTYMAGRSIMQAVPSFDLYWRLHRTHRPDLSIFFTNHVAGMMHRYWGDAMDDYATVDSSYESTPSFGKLIGRAMDVADVHFGRIRRYVEKNPDSVLIIAGSMGQHAVPLTMHATQMVLGEPERLFETLRLGSVELGSAMYPRYSILLDDASTSEEVSRAITSVSLDGDRRVFTKVRVTGHTLQFQFMLDHDVTSDEHVVSYLPSGCAEVHTASLGTLGISLRERLGGGDTGHHTPEGIAIAYGTDVTPDQSRRRVDLLDMAPSILRNVLLAAPAPSMQGAPTLFVPSHAGYAGGSRPQSAANLSGS